jgi:hypothetical protein
MSCESMLTTNPIATLVIASCRDCSLVCFMFKLNQKIRNRKGSLFLLDTHARLV